MKRSMFSARRWFAVLILSLLLCGAGALNAFALPVEPAEPMPDRASLGEDRQEAGPPAPDLDTDASATAAEAAAPAAVADVADGLITYWKLDETSGDPVDSSPYHLETHLAYGWTDGWTTEHAPTTLANTGSLRFHSAHYNSFYTQGNPGLGGHSFTVAAWANRDGVNVAHTIFSGGDNPLDGQTINFGFSPANQFVCSFGPTSKLVTTQAVDSAGWHHYACTYDFANNARKIYQDGILIASDTSTVDYVGTGQHVVGAYRGPSYTDFFDGWIDEVRLYNRMLSSDELTVLGQRAKHRKPVAYWKLDGTGDDSSTSGSHDLSIGTGLPSSPSYVSVGAPTAFTNSHHVELDWLDTVNIDQYLTTPDAAELNPLDELSVTAWVNPRSANINRVLVNKGTWALKLDLGRVGALVYMGSTVYINTTQDIALNAWTHVALTYRKGDKLRLFVNGSEVVSADTANFLGSSTQAVTVGSTNGAADPAGSGSMDMDDIRIYDRQISPEEVAGLAGEGAQAYWRLDNDLTDSSGNGHTLTALDEFAAFKTEPAPTSYVNTHSSYFDSYYSNVHAAMDPSETSYAVSLWFKTFRHNVGIYSVASADHIDYDRDIYLKDDKVCARVWASYGAEEICTGGAGYGWGGWHHVVHTFGGDVGPQRLYVDGVLAATGTRSASGYTYSGQNVYIAYSKAAAPYPGIVGSVDEVRVFSRALIEGEVKELYRGPCYARPEDALEGSDGTVYSSLSAAAVQASLDLLGVGGGTVKLSGNCVGTTTHSGSTQTALIETGHSRSSVTLDGGWNSTFSAQDPISTPTTLDAASSGRVVLVASGSAGSAFLNNLTLTHGRIAGSGGGLLLYGPTTLHGVTVSNNAATNMHGGGIYVTNAFTMTNSTVSGNTASSGGGGLFFDGTVSYTLKNTTISGNTAASDGGGIFLNHGTLRLASVTVTDNQAGSRASGIKNDSGTVFVKNSIIAGNRVGANYGQDVDNLGTFTTLGGNLLGNGASADYDQAVSYDRLKLGALANNGGATQTHLPAADSPAIDAGFCAGGAEEWWHVEADQRGSSYLRPGGGTTLCDAGVVEVQSVTANCFASRSTAPDYASANGRALQMAIDSLPGGTGTVRVGGTCTGAWYKGGTVQTARLGGGITLIGGDKDSYLTANPNGHAVLDARGLGRVLLATAGTNSARNLELTGGNTNANGGGLLNQGTLTLENSLIQTNSVTGSGMGGGVANEGTLMLSSGTIQANTGTGGGGGIYAGGVLAITDTTIRGNSTASSWAKGGGIYVTGQVTLNDSTVASNVSSGEGGGVYVTANSTLTTTNSTVSSNHSNLSTGGIHSAGTLQLRFATVTGNSGPPGEGANLYKDAAASATLYAVAIANPQGGGSNCGGSAAFTSHGYNRSSDGSCSFSGSTTDLKDAVIELKALGANGGPTLTHLPVGVDENTVVDVISKAECEAFFDAEDLELLDQRGMLRPRVGKRGSDLDPQDARCDVGAVELGAEKHYVCGPPLDAEHFPERCEEPTVASALSNSLPGDVIVISGVVTEKVTIDKDILIRGPLPTEATPCTQMGIVQAAAVGPDGMAPFSGSVFTIQKGVKAVIAALNIRYGDAEKGGGINNSGTLLLAGVTLYQNRATYAGAIYNSGTLTVTQSTLTDNSASYGNIFNGIYSDTGGKVAITHSTLANDGQNLHNPDGSMTVGSSIIDTRQCFESNATSLGYNLVSNSNDDCFTLTGTDQIGDAQLGPLRDNGGPTLTRDPSAASPAVDKVPQSVCASAQMLEQLLLTTPVDQRMRTRPVGPLCDIGAVESGRQRLRVCQGCDDDPANLTFGDLQTALNWGVVGDTVAIEAGVYTGNFVAYKDLTLQHAGIDTTRLNRDQPTDVRAILQASDLSIREQSSRLDPQQVSGLSGSVLTTGSCKLTDTTIVPSGEVEVTLRGLTIQHGLARLGGGIYNLGRLAVYSSTIADNAAVNQLDQYGNVVSGAEAKGGGIYNAGTLTLERSTVSGNQSEYHGGALYTRGQSESAMSTVTIEGSTVAYNSADKLPAQHVVTVDSSPAFEPSLLAGVVSGDYVQFKSTGPGFTLLVQGTGCNADRIEVPPLGGGLSPDLICTAKGSSSSVTVSISGYERPVLQITVAPPGYTADGQALYVDQFSDVALARSIVVHRQGGDGNCKIFGIPAKINSLGDNVTNDSSCNLTAAGGDVVWDSAEPVEASKGGWLGELQDNNRIDFEGHTVSSTTYSHALLPNSPAIDLAPPEACGVAPLKTVALSSEDLNLTLQAGDVVKWIHTETVSRTVSVNDGEYNAMLVPVPENASPVPAAARGASREVQFNMPGSYRYVVYDEDGQETGIGTITVAARERSTDQRGLPAPQRGSPMRNDGAGGSYGCDSGAFEFAPWVVGQPLPRPPSAIGTQPPSWKVGGDANTDTYHVWSTATALDLGMRPSPDNGDATWDPRELVELTWKTDPDPASTASVTQVGLVEWPDNPQLHVEGARVDVGHDKVSDGFIPSRARAFEGRDPADDAAGQILSNGVFTRTLLTGATHPGDSYSVLEYVKGNQTNAAHKVQVVQTVGWITTGVRDMRPPVTVCEIGRELQYPTHEDPLGKAGQILDGEAFDGVHAQADLTEFRNTVDGLVPPAYVQETREGPIIPILNTAPTTFANNDPVVGGHDLRVAWYRTDDRNVAWPVRSVGYRCAWPETLPKIVIASELGSEIGGQPVLDAEDYADVTVYHQPLPDKPGFNPNDEHALLSASNLGNSAPALYALRSDLWDETKKAETSETYALLKYRDPREDGRTKISIYKVVLTRDAEAITDVIKDPGTVTIAESIGAAPAAAPQASPSATVRVGDGSVRRGGEVTVPLEVLGVSDLRSAVITVSYDPNKLVPIECTPDREDFVERPYNLHLVTDGEVKPLHIIHMRAWLDAGTNVEYEWDFGDGTTRIDIGEVSHVYSPTVTSDLSYTVIVTATNGFFPPVSEETTVLVSENADQGYAASGAITGCREETPGQLTFELISRNKHGLSGNLVLAELTFGAADDATLGPTELGLPSVQLTGPGYEELQYTISAGGPVYAPTPMRALLDVRPCPQTQAADVRALPFWKDFKNMLWARAAGDMEILYFYPLQEGFYLTDEHAKELGLVDPKTNEPLSPEKRAGRCIPWMDKLAEGTKIIDYEDDLGVARAGQVLPVGYHAVWPDLPPLLSVGETVYQRSKSGISGVASQVAVERIYDDVAPGAWDNEAKKITLEGAEVQEALTQLIDPTDEVRVPLELEINGSPGLPAHLKTERLLYGGGVAIVGTADYEEQLPFSLRSRILFDDAKGELIFRGYYDGTSAGYIKGDPLLLLNVMSESDKTRLLALCLQDPEDEQSTVYRKEAESAECEPYVKAVKELYHLTLNPRKLDLCRDEHGNLYPGDPEPAANQAALTEDMEECPPKGGITYYRDGVADEAFLIGAQDALTIDTNNDEEPDASDGVPEPFQGLGKGKALTAGNAADTGYVTVAYNNDPSLGGLPVSLQVIRIGCEKNQQGEDSTYRGNLLVIESDNLFDEKLTLRHTGDFGGRPDNFDFEWYIAAVDDTGVSPANLPQSYPWTKWTKFEPGADALGSEMTIEGANPTTLSDNWLIMRYKGYRACGNEYYWSAFAGDPSAKPSEVRAQLAEGWIKRVTNALNPYDARVTDFESSPVSTSVDMIRQAGKRYEGPVAMNNDPANLNSMGLIEAYQTVLDRGRLLSIDANINDQGANAALLNMSSRIADLYMLLGNDANADALDPTVGLGSTSELANRAPAIYAFMNQFHSDSFGLIDEELALLRGRDETLGGVAAGPTYNRLTWNFTNSDGEVAYVMNYNMKDVNRDGFIDEVDGATLYPQGHGDAWGHMLTATQKYYELLRHPNYTWVPRAEPLAVAGAPVVVDYYDERRFAIAASNKAKMGAEITDLTYRKHYADPESQEYVDTAVDSSDQCDVGAMPGCNRRAWGVADWARRAEQGAYFDWVVANAIVPPEDYRYTDLRKIDRTTVLEIRDIAEQARAVQTKLDNADTGVNPLGLAQDALLFDLDPARTKTTADQEGLTHFEQVYERAIASFSNALALFDYANEMKIALRNAQNEQWDFESSILAEDRARINELIEIFGYPYEADIGVNGTYPDGYEGPDLYNYMLLEKTDLTNAAKRCAEHDIGTAECPEETETFLVKYKPIVCVGYFADRIGVAEDLDRADVCKDVSTEDEFAQEMEIEYKVGLGLDAGRGIYLPEAWPEGTTRKAWGEIQNKLWGVYDARVKYESAITKYQNQIEKIEEQQEAIEDKADTLGHKYDHTLTQKVLDDVADGVIALAKQAELILKKGEEKASNLGSFGGECLPQVNGIDNDMTSGVRCMFDFSGEITAAGLSAAEVAWASTETWLELAKEVQERAVELDLLSHESNAELRQMGREIQASLREEEQLRLELFLAADEFAGAQSDYDAVVAKGMRKLKDLALQRQRWAGQITAKRYGDMAYRTFQYDALQKYRQQFELAQQYAYLTAAAYDYETNLARNDAETGTPFLRQIVGERTLGAARRGADWQYVPIAGSHGLADSLAKMRDDFVVLKGQMGFNNPQDEANRFSLRRELLRLVDTSDAKWRHELQRYYMADIYANPQVAKLAKRPYGEDGPQPGLVIPFGTTIKEGLNTFGWPLGPGDSAYDASQFATKIASVGVWFEGYDTTRLANTPRIYLLPAGNDVVRPRGAQGVLRFWQVTEQLLPVPYPLGEADMKDPDWIAGIDGLNGRMFAIKPYTRMRAYPYTPDFEPTELETDTRLIGRSVWNTQWILVIPGTTLLADPDMGLDRFIEDVNDIYIYFQTYAYAGTAAASAGAASAKVATSETITATVGLEEGAAATLGPNPMPQPDVMFYGVALRDGTPLTSGTLTAILPRLGTIQTQIAPIAGTKYNYALHVPLGYYDPADTNYAADSARPGETVRFTINGVPALLKDTPGISYQAYTIKAPGEGYAITVDVSGPGSYPIGDVNVSGKRDAADALLVLKYDVGLTPGVTTWPPGPATVYLPLCDVTEDGACNSSDALRVLLCEVNLASCGPQSVTAANAAAEVPADAPPVYLSTEQEFDAGTGQVVVRVRAESPGTPLAIASLGLRYDPTQVSVASCTENPAGRLDLAVCNPAYASDTVRYTGITTGGIVEAAPLLELRLRPVDATVLQQIAGGSPAIEIAEATLFDLEGNALRPVLNSKEPATIPRKIFLPIILAGAGSPGTEVAPEPPAAEPTPEPTVAEPTPDPTAAESTPEPTVAEPTPEPQVEPTAASTPEIVSTPEPPAAEPTPEVALTLAAP